jgi:HAD superfamily hydrolase (TIGR01509 family)
MTITAIVFDIGGVLVRTEDRSGRIALENQYQLPPGGVDELVFNSKIAADSTVGKANSERIWQYIAEKLSLTPEALGAFQKSFWSGDQLDKELVEFIGSLRKTFTIALLTNAWEGARNILAKQYNIVERITVDHLLISSELGFAKPDQKIFYILSDTIAAPFHQILFVDDFYENIAAAGLLGMHTIHYKSGMNLIAQIQNRVNQ